MPAARRSESVPIPYQDHLIARSVPLLFSLPLQIVVKPLKQSFHVRTNRRPRHEHNRRVPLPRSKMPEQSPARLFAFARRLLRREVKRPRSIKSQFTACVLVAEDFRAVFLLQRWLMYRKRSRKNTKATNPNLRQPDKPTREDGQRIAWHCFKAADQGVVGIGSRACDGRGNDEIGVPF